jgi:hypothetical protein
MGFFLSLETLLFLFVTAQEILGWFQVRRLTWLGQFPGYMGWMIVVVLGSFEPQARPIYPGLLKL